MTDEHDTRNTPQGEGHTLGRMEQNLDGEGGAFLSVGKMVRAIMRGPKPPQKANARRIAAAWNACEGIPTEALEDNVVADMLEALRLHQAWIDNENAGPDYGGQSRDTHPDGEKIWRAWFYGNVDLCDRASRATRAAIAKATRGAA